MYQSAAYAGAATAELRRLLAEHPPASGYGSCDHGSRNASAATQPQRPRLRILIPGRHDILIPGRHGILIAPNMPVANVDRRVHWALSPGSVDDTSSEENPGERSSLESWTSAEWIHYFHEHLSPTPPARSPSLARWSFWSSTNSDIQRQSLQPPANPHHLDALLLAGPLVLGTTLLILALLWVQLNYF